MLFLLLSLSFSVLCSYILLLICLKRLIGNLAY